MRGSFQIGALLAALIGAGGGAAHADVLYFSNAAAVFTWEESYDVNFQFFHGTSLDIMLPASQTGELAPFGMQAYSETYFTSNQLVTTRITPDVAGNVTVARGPDVLIPNGPWSGFVSPAISFASGALIGPDAGGGTWDVNADIDYRTGQITGSLINGRAFVGITLHMADGPHYGWIDLIDHGYNDLPSFVPVAWAWETTPHTPIAAGVVPGPSGVVIVAGGMAMLRRRRRTV